MGEDKLQKYNESLKIHNIDIEVVKRKVSMLVDFPLFKDGIMNIYVSNEYQHSGLNILRRLNDANSWIRKATDLFRYIRYSVNTSLAYLDKCEHIFTPYRVTEEYKIVFYYVENALFRLFTAWDVLGQLYNHLFDMQVDIEKVNYNKIFQKSSCDFMNDWLERVIGHHEAIDIVKQEYLLIKEYITTEYVYNNGITKGHHKYLMSIRHMAVHREDPHSFSIINSSKRIKHFVDAPQYELMNIAEESVQLYQFITTVIKLYYFEFSGQGLDLGEIQVIKSDDL